jgi:hypothetical protein
MEEWKKQKQEYLAKKNRNYLLLGLREYERFGRIPFFDPEKGHSDPEGTPFFHEILSKYMSLLQETQRVAKVYLRAPKDPYEWLVAEKGDYRPLTDEEYEGAEATVDVYLKTLKAKKEYDRRKARVAERRAEEEKALVQLEKPNVVPKRITFLMAGGGGGS